MTRIVKFFLMAMTWSASSDMNLLAAPLVDQEQAIADPGGQTRVSHTSLLGAYQVAQEVGVGITGKFMAVELLANTYDGRSTSLPLYAEIHHTDGYGYPLEDAIAVSTPVWPTTSPTPEYVTLDFSSSNLSVAAGDLLSIVLWSSDSQGYRVKGAYANPYNGRTLYRRLYSVEPYWQPSFDPGFDLTFRTLVEPVPEPNSPVVARFGGIFLLCGAKARLLNGVASRAVSLAVRFRNPSPLTTVRDAALGAGKGAGKGDILLFISRMSRMAST